VSGAHRGARAVALTAALTAALLCRPAAAENTLWDRLSKGNRLPYQLAQDPLCARRIRGFEMLDKETEHKVHDADVEASAAADAKSGVEAQIKEVNADLAKAQKTVHDTANAPAGEAPADATVRQQSNADAQALVVTLQARLPQLATDLEAAKKRREAAGRLQTQLWYDENELDVDSSRSCVPNWAFGAGLSGAAGAGNIWRWAIEGEWRLRLRTTLAVEIDASYAFSDGLVENGRRKMLLFGGRFRQGRGNMGELYYGPGLALASRDGVDLAAIYVQVGYSYSPARSRESRGGSDWRIFIEPWLPVGGWGTSVLVGVSYGFVALKP
jgi:hypothetical protein